MSKKYFGTDGIRGMVGSQFIHPEFILKLGWAVGRVFAKTGRKKVLIGKDTRVSGYMFESALEAGLSAAGVDVGLLGPMPTPAIAYLTQTFRACAGIVISASHNAYEDNGIKFFDAQGGKLPDEIEYAIEEELEKPFVLVNSNVLGKANRISDAPGRYIEFCKSTIPSLTRFSGLKIVLDCANGATYHVAPNVFKELGANVISIADKPDGFNINHLCGSTQPESLQAQVLAHRADLGIAFDGDGDRVTMVDKNGKIINGDGVLYLIAGERYLHQKLAGGVVGTLMTNMALELKFKAMSIPFLRTNVGDRYVLSALKENNWVIGGETSGHVVCLDKTTTGDGIVASLQVLTRMVQEQKSLDELMSGISFFPQMLINFKTKQPKLWMANETIQSEILQYQKDLGSNGRIVVRPSGTEPVVRVLLEGEDLDKLNLIKSRLEEVVTEAAI